MTWWHVGAAANTVVAVAYLAIAIAIGRSLTASRQWRANPLATATAAIFLTCAVHHGLHPYHQLLVYAGLEERTGEAMRTAFDDWHIALWDVVTAAVAVWYWTLRGRFPALVRGAAVFGDVEVRRREALEIHDNIVQGLATAKLSFELDRREEGMRAVEETLAASRRMITEMLGEDGPAHELRPGHFRREQAAGRA